MFGRLDLGGGSKRNGDDRVLEELALDRRYLQVNTPEKPNREIYATKVHFTFTLKQRF